MVSDKIILKNMLFYGYHGAFSAEREMGQRFEVDVEMKLDLTRSGKEDDIELTVNYVEVYQLIKRIIESKVFELLEALTYCIVESILEDYPIVDEVTVTVRKPGAPLGGVADYAAIEITRGRERS